MGRSPPKRQRKPKAGHTKGDRDPNLYIGDQIIRAVADHIANTSGIWPTEFNVLIKQKDVEESIEVKRHDGTTTQLWKPQPAVEKEQYAEMEGTLIATSPLAFTFERWPEGARKPQPGDKVIIAKYSGTRVVGKDGQTYLLTKDKDISAIREA